jgi:hypothetical protein
MDLRELVSAPTPVPQSFYLSIDLPATFESSGPITASLWIPDPASSLSNLPAYALPLNSVDDNEQSVFNAATGDNVFATFNAR